jgi:hypothetical protein
VMTPLAQPPTTLHIRMIKGRRDEVPPSVRLRLLPSRDGWSLLGPDGELVFQALGTRGRRQCLEFAQAQGVLAVFS